jgi:P pilus assembly chaperone PapD
MTHPTRWLTALLAALIPSAAMAQGVIVAPHAVYIDHATRAGSITLFNPGDQPVEVSVSFGFGYPTTDSAGAVSLELTDDAPQGQPGATAWLQAFPRRATVAPHERQTVRVLATPPTGLPDGEYWARLIVGAKGGQIAVAGVTDTAAVKVGLSLEVRTVIAVVYRKGALTTGLTLDHISATYADDSVGVRVPLTRTGTGAYLGTVRASVVDARGEVKGEEQLPVAVYYALDPRLPVPVGTLAPGTYKVRVSVSTERTDLPPKVPLPAPPVRDSVEITVR